MQMAMLVPSFLPTTPARALRDPKRKRSTLPPAILGRIKRALWRKQQGHCFYCHTPLLWPGRFWVYADVDHTLRTQAILEHKLAVVHGGSNNIENLVLSCRDCNLEKSTMTAEDFQIWIESGQPLAAARKYWAA
jgi:5-methylcytosine-specific restriction endonuclease McrA